MPSNDLSLIIDPGGISGIREGINLRVYPSGSNPGQFQPVGPDAERLSNSGLSAGGFDYLYEFETTVHLKPDEFQKLRSLLAWNENRRIQNQPWEVVIYNLVEPFSEISQTQTRLKVPDTNILKQVPESFGLTYYEYWVAIQGALRATYTQEGECWKVELTFKEGTRLTP